MFVAWLHKTINNTLVVILIWVANENKLWANERYTLHWAEYLLFSWSRTTKMHTTVFIYSQQKKRFAVDFDLWHRSNSRLLAIRMSLFFVCHDIFLTHVNCFLCVCVESVCCSRISIDVDCVLWSADTEPPQRSRCTERKCNMLPAVGRLICMRLLADEPIGVVSYVSWVSHQPTCFSVLASIEWLRKSTVLRSICGSKCEMLIFPQFISNASSYCWNCRFCWKKHECQQTCVFIRTHFQ